MAKRRGASRRIADQRNLRAFFQHLCSINGEQADQLLAIRFHEIGPCEGTLADEIGFGFTNRPIEPKIIRRDGAVGFLADNDVALLGA